jgi:hypothetical protein
MENASFHTLPSSPVGALSRIQINRARIMLHGKLNPSYSSTGDISVRSLTIEQMEPPQEFCLTFSNLSRVSVQLDLEGNSGTSRPLTWLPAFMERHPKLSCIELAFWPCHRALKWHALKDVPLLTSFCDAVDRQHLLSSFSLTGLTAERAVTDDQFDISVAHVELGSPIFDIIRCIGSYMPVSHTLSLKFTERRILPDAIPLVCLTIEEFQSGLA